MVLRGWCCKGAEAKVRSIATTTQTGFLAPPAAHTAMSTTPLFRPEVMQAQSTQWLGSIRIGRPPSFGVVTSVALACAAALISFATLGEYTRKVNVPGVLVPEGGLMNLSSPQPATVAEVLVKEGDAVQAGQPLIRLRAERVLANGELGQLQLAAVAQRRASLDTELRLAEQQAQQRRNALQDRLRSLQSDATNLQGELEATQQRVQLAQVNTQRFNELAASGYVSGVQAQQKQEDLLDLNLRERNARRALEAATREQASVQAELSSMQTQLDTTRSQLQRQLSSLAQEGGELDARSAWTITAPQAGTVSALSATLGQSAAAGSTLVSLLPRNLETNRASHLIAHLYAPSRKIGFLLEGQTVWLRYAAYPYQKFGMHAGRVILVSQTPINPQDLPIGQAQALMQSTGGTEPLYRITVSLAQQTLLAHGNTQALKTGMALEAQIRQEQRSIWEWAIEPVLSMRKNHEPV
jgi:membrane fusion protein